MYRSCVLSSAGSHWSGSETGRLAATGLGHPPEQAVWAIGPRVDLVITPAKVTFCWEKKAYASLPLQEMTTSLHSHRPRPRFRIATPAPSDSIGPWGLVGGRIHPCPPPERPRPCTPPVRYEAVPSEPRPLLFLRVPLCSPSFPRHPFSDGYFQVYCPFQGIKVSPTHHVAELCLF